MESQVTNNPQALALFFTEDVFAVADKLAPNIAKENTTSLNSKTQTPVPEAVAEEKLVDYNNMQETAMAVEEPKAPVSFEYLGGNKKQFLILVSDDKNKVSTEAGNALLKNILKFLQLKTEDFALANIANQGQVQFSTLNSFFKPKVMLAFGVEPAALELVEISSGQMHNQENVKVIFTRDLHNLSNDATAKKILIENLKGFTL